MKPELEAELGLSKTELGLLDLSLLLPYAGIQILFSSQGDRTAPKTMIFVCLSMSSLSMAAFGGLTNGIVLACIFLFFNGTAQVESNGTMC